MIILAMIPMILQAKGCWTAVEKADFAQDWSSDKIRFSVKDAISCQPIVNGDFFIGKIEFHTDKKGIIKVPTPPEDMSMELPIMIRKDGYITTKEHINVVFGSFRNKLFLMSKTLPIHSARFVLSWGKKPSDLDIHLKTDTYHISFRNTKNIRGTAKLDRDAREGYGPETITVNRLNKDNNYKLIVHSYSGEELNSDVHLSVYLNNKLDKMITLQKTKSRCVQVATIHNNKIQYHQKDLQVSECK